MADVRLQRYLAQAGVASRRKAEELILAGRVKVNGRVVRELGSKVDPLNDRVDFDGHRLVAEDHVWILLNKPGGTVSTASDPEGRKTVLDLVGSQGVRLYPVGRLDFHTEGVLLLTNDGALAAALMHPRNQVARIYHVKLRGIIDPLRLDDLREGVTITDDEGRKRSRVAADQVAIRNTTGKHTWLEVTLREGRNRQIHRMMDAVGFQVIKLIRVSYAGLTTEGLPPGRYRALSQTEINELRALVNLPGETKRRAEASPTRSARKPAPRPRRPGAKRTGSAGKKKPGAARGRPGDKKIRGRPVRPGKRD